MLLFSLFSPGLALRLFIVVNPLLAGLALYGFLRKETLGRSAATAGGLVLAMTMSTSTIAISLPFAGALAWSGRAVAGRVGVPLVGVARVARARAFAWEQAPPPT